MSQKQSEKMTYENAMLRIEEIVSEMENTSVTLDRSSELFEEAVKLISFCNDKLKETELKITKIDEKKDF